jgi:hypothetical protein
MPSGQYSRETTALSDCTPPFADELTPPLGSGRMPTPDEKMATLEPRDRCRSWAVHAVLRAAQIDVHGEVELARRGLLHGLECDGRAADTGGDLEFSEYP